jgi:N-methylhydantoinase A
MVNAIKLISVNRGLDPRDFTLIAFGGGGGLHACALARDLGIRKVVIPSLSGVFSAWGMLLSDLRRDYLLTRIVDLADAKAAALISEAFTALETESIRQFEAENINRKRVRFLRYARCRYQNQEHSVEIDLPQGDLSDAGLAAVREHFHASYEREYTYRLPAPVELVCFHLVAMAEVDKLQPQRRTATGRKIEEAVKGTREVDYAEAGVTNAVIYNGDLLEPGMAFQGPAIIEESGTTVVVPPGMPCRVDDYGNYVLGRDAEGERGQGRRSSRTGTPVRPKGRPR